MQFKEKIDKCLRCGICLSYCPVYGLERHEGTSPRGKVNLMQYLLNQKITPTSRLQHFFDLCIGCMACVDTCPVKIPTSDVVFAVRNLYDTSNYQPFIIQLINQLIFKKPDIKEAIISNLNLPSYLLNNIEEEINTDNKFLLDTAVPQPLWEQYKKYGKISISNVKKNIIYFSGCMTKLIYPQTGLAIITLLEHLGFNVIVPNTACCGYFEYTNGNIMAAQEQAKKNIELLKSLAADIIITDCPSCNMALHSYHKWFNENDNSEKNQAISNKVIDINAFLTKFCFEPGPFSAQHKVTYSDSCLLKNGCKVSNQPYQMLKTMSGLDYIELPHADNCCGGCNGFSQKFPDLSQQLLEDKIQNIKSTNADIVATGCPHCRYQISQGIKNANLKFEIVHPTDLYVKTI